MVSDYDLDKRLTSLLPVLDEYTAWFMQVIRQLSYPKFYEEGQAIEQPYSFADWVAQARQSSLQPGVINKLDELHSDLISTAEGLAAQTFQSRQSPSFDDFDRLAIFFEEFIQHMTRLEKDCFLDNTGLDSLTGLRSGSLLEKEYKRELERLARQGRSFCIALVRIDLFGDIRAGGGIKLAEECLLLVSDLIKKSIRSFDDAYRLPNDDIVLMLKQTDVTGGIRALKRLTQEIDKEGFRYRLNDVDKALSLSSCIAEPLPGEDLSRLLENLRADLQKINQEKGSVLEYFELSPLQRYAKSFQERDG